MPLLEKFRHMLRTLIYVELLYIYICILFQVESRLMPQNKLITKYHLIISFISIHEDSVLASNRTISNLRSVQVR